MIYALVISVLVILFSVIMLLKTDFFMRLWLNKYNKIYIRIIASFFLLGGIIAVATNAGALYKVNQIIPLSSEELKTIRVIPSVNEIYSNTNRYQVFLKYNRDYNYFVDKETGIVYNVILVLHKDDIVIVEGKLKTY